MSETTASAAEQIEAPVHIARAVANFAMTQQRFEEAKAEMEAVRAFIDRVNSGLPVGVMVGTRSSWSNPTGYIAGREKDPGVGPSVIYTKQPDGDYLATGSIVTDGKQFPFLGNRLIEDRGRIVVINDELELGLAAKDEVFMVDTNDDPKARTLGGPTLDQFNEGLLPMLREVKPGEHREFDCSYY